MASKIVCVGRNYAEHAKELNNPIPKEPLLFIKPTTALCDFEQPINVSQAPYPIHYEAELAILIGNKLTKVSPEQANRAIEGIGAALDLTYRDLQTKLKAKGHPWEIAKAFDNSCPITRFINFDKHDLNALEYRFFINEKLRQHGKTQNMLVNIPDLLSYISQHFTLEKGDIVLTGTPAGVGELIKGDKLKLEVCGVLKAETEVS
ncbi:fumarylacetoacetate hydrolase family protein [Parashewanella tropica]|uniref:fumarylacetoacetate hydrolase family protein n=1 Tax=Parashewanella tropica TaxID=2547970 RepID=UPI00105A3F83|nr:fumarylacetoacetate hydrolase family protein [Parashewanella tropica]